jgi:hypothetical protein
MVDWQFHYMTKVMILTLQSSTFLIFYVLTYHFHLLIVCISPSWFDTACFAYDDFSNRGKLLTKKLMLQGYIKSRLKSSFCKFYGRYNDLFCDFKLSLAHMLNDLFHTLCKTVMSILALTTGNPVYIISTEGARRMWPVFKGCLLLRGTWSYLRICRGSVLPYTRFCNCLLHYDYMYVLHIVNFATMCMFQRCDLVPRRNKHHLSTSHTHRGPYFQIRWMVRSVCQERLNDWYETVFNLMEGSIGKLDRYKNRNIFCRKLTVTRLKKPSWPQLA